MEGSIHIPKRFVGSTSNQMTYQAHGRLPTPNKSKYVNLTTGHGRFYGQTSYGLNFFSRHDEDYRELKAIERERVKEHKKRFQRGSISPYRKLPFIGR